MLTQSRLKEVLHYDPDTGVLVWITQLGSRAKIGSEAGSVTKQGRTYYRLIMIDKHHYYAHRLAWLYVHGEFPEKHIDHEDGNGLNNRIKNLRDVDRVDNSKNQRLSKRNKSGFIGVSFHNPAGKWVADIRVNGKTKYLGIFAEIDDAVKARKAAELQYGYHPNHGQNKISSNEGKS